MIIDYTSSNHSVLNVSGKTGTLPELSKGGGGGGGAEESELGIALYALNLPFHHY